MTTGSGGAADKMTTGASRGGPVRRDEERFDGIWMPRRDFFSTVAWAATGVSVLGAIVASVRMMFPKVLFDPPMTFTAGFPEEYQVGEVSERWKKRYRTWIIRTDEGFFALSAKCTHLGCTPNWIETEGKFKCPCHGSGFDPAGVNFEGPAPRPLERFRIAMDENGRILVDKSRLFRQEAGEWDHPDAFLRV
ncbi:MAG: ubiquinol-cytochrome c reductase iron-sulfur subunit [Acidobacteria bacterium]|nr:ubiquinol-cytochrome c reductase iron-sulfur subunit [Acidobacteriota bacterium]